MGILDKIKQKDSRTAELIALGVAGVVTGLVLVFWFSGLSTRLSGIKQTATASLAGTSPLDYFVTNIKDLFQMTKDGVASTTTEITKAPVSHKSDSLFIGQKVTSGDTTPSASTSPTNQ